jgi:hypothetical protein
VRDRNLITARLTLFNVPVGRLHGAVLLLDADVTFKTACAAIAFGPGAACQIQLAGIFNLRDLFVEI